MKLTCSIDEEIEGAIKKSGSKEEVGHERVLATRFRFI